MSKLVGSDIYELQNYINEIKKQNIDLDEDTLSMGIFGYLGDVFSHLIQNNVLVTSEYINEMFPTRVKYEKNILDHALLYNITDINATPATMQVTICLMETEVLEKMKNNKLYIDRKCPIYIGEFEFHLEYDIILTRSLLNNSNVMYTARYDIQRKNPISTISNPYLTAPVIQKIGNSNYIFITCQMRQITYSEVYKKIISDNYIINKSFEFEFEDQMSTFDLKIVDGNETFYITPLLEGSSTANVSGKYCYYKFVDSSNIRVIFESASYIPNLNTDITVNLTTTRGKEGNFEYIDDIITSLTSETYGYSELSVMVKPLSDSEYGVDRTSVKELKEIIPRESLARGSITTTTDLTNYFNTISTDDNVLTFMDKVDNQLNRTYYSYLLLRDENGVIVPTNTLDLQLLYYDNSVEPEYDEEGNLIKQPGDFDSQSEQRCIIKPGTKFKLEKRIISTALVSDALDQNGALLTYVNGIYSATSDPNVFEKNIGGETFTATLNPITNEWTLTHPTMTFYNYKIVKKEEVNWYGHRLADDEIYDDNKEFIYSLPFLMIVNIKPLLYTSYYLNIINRKYNLYITSNNINENSDLQFIALKCQWKREFNVDRNYYKLIYQCTQNINEDKGLVTLDDNGNIIASKIRSIALMDGQRGKSFSEANLTKVFQENNTFIYEFEFRFRCEDLIDSDNYINIMGLQRAERGMPAAEMENFFPRNTDVDIYILYEGEEQYGQKGLELYIPEDYERPITNYTVSNIYSVEGGIEFFFNYTDIISSKVSITQEFIDEAEGLYRQYFRVRSVPSVRASYINDENKINKLMDIIETKRGYIENALKVLKDQFGIDFKFYNTYGPSRTFYIDNTLLDRVNITLNFDVGLKTNADRSNIAFIINDIKEYIENLNNTKNDLHMSNVITEITNKYLYETLNFIEFVSINEYPTNKQFLSRIDTEKLAVDCPPEFINIHYTDNEEIGISVNIVG